MAKPKHDWLTPAQFNKLTDEDKKVIIDKIRDLYINKLYNDVDISNELNISYKLSSIIRLNNNIKRNQEQTNEYVKKQSIKKYGVDSPNKSLEVRQKLKDAWHNKNDKEKEKIINKRKSTNLKKYGNTCSLHGSNQEKIEKAFLNKYGVNNPWQAKHIRDKIKNKYGDENPFNCKICQDKVKQTKLEKYGDPYYTNIEQTKKTTLERYGVECIYQLEKFRIKSGSISKINQRFAKLLKENNIEFEQEFNIKNKSYDFKVGNILIEVNPTYTHNSTVGAWFGNNQDNPLSKTYHLEKSKLAKENGFHCIHIFDWDDWNKIINLLLPKHKMYARKCELKEVSKKECDEFLNMYHLQNTCNGQKIRYGLHYNNKLIQIMTFGKPRYNKNYEWELLRLCSHKDYIVIGGSQKLFKHFLKMQNPRNIISYCDNSKFSGDVYLSLGMTLKNITKPNVQWSKKNLHITSSLLKQRGFDQLFNASYGKGSSNRELMIEDGWKEVYDCGQQVYVLEEKFKEWEGLND